ncbi:hypothetical protein TSAR_013606 [Trichomalopsis sarcophagae]|uniref:BTB domain-containing protein n=1 Tax=Trichomalopsis sarcophagae TaxID=543379 RepID=A0A232EWU4_9HYME|nr:hypothetical protein TSAR_013606 [Trichomalopsis sarcophagae]
MVITLLNARFLWTIDNVSRINCQDEIISPKFVIHGDDHLQMQLFLYPKTIGEQTDSSVEIELVSHLVPRYQSRFIFSIINSKDEKIKTSSLVSDRQTHYVDSIANFININHAKEPENGLIVDGNIRILCEVETIGDNFQQLSRESASKLQLSKDMEFFFHNEKFSDVVLIDSTGKKIHAHKLILAARSTVFAGMFEHNMKEETEGTVTIPNIEYDCLKEMLRFIYTGKVENLENLAVDLLSASDQYALQDLKDMCESVLSSSVTTETAIATLVIADKHSTSVLKSNVLKFIVENSKDVIATVGFQSLQSSHIDLVKEVLCAVVNARAFT